MINSNFKGRKMNIQISVKLVRGGDFYNRFAH